MSAHDISADSKPDLPLEIAHLLLIDLVGYSKLLLNEQVDHLRKLTRIVRETRCFREAEESGKLVRLPTGDGMALLFYRNPEEPVLCALEISQGLKACPNIHVRMGIHSGPITTIQDVNEKLNIAGGGINVAQRVMDCGDAGHILVSKHVAEDLAEYRHWQPYLKDLGECETKHGLRLHIFNLCKDDLGNPAIPEKLRGRKGHLATERRAVFPAAWQKWALSILLAAGIAAATLSIFFHRGPLPQFSDKSIAVLPFQDLSDEKENAFFAEGMQEEILTALARVADLKVISRTSVMQFPADAKRNLREIARSLGVANILEGSVQRLGERVKVYAQLVDARTDTQLWANKYERPLKDVFAIQSEVAENIVSELKSKLSPPEKAAIERPPTSDLLAYDLYTRAKTIILEVITVELSSERLADAVGLLEKAVKRDPAFLLAYYQLANAHDEFYHLGYDHTAGRLALAETAIESMERLRPGAGETHLARARHLYWGYMDYDRARAELQLARAKLPNDPSVFLFTGYIDRRQGRWQESTMNMERALELDPRNLLVLQQMSLTYESLRRYADQAEILDRAVQIAPGQLGLRIQRASVDLNWRADSKPLHAAIDAILAAKSESISEIGDQWLYLALCERDKTAAQRALNVMLPDGCNRDGIPFPVAWCEAMAARTSGDAEAARNAFLRARIDVDQIARNEPKFAKAICALGLIDAALGYNEEAVKEGQRATELLPVSKDVVDGSLLVQYLAIIYAWTGDKDAALDQLTLVATLPGYLSYGHLRLHPFWDPLRGDRRFEKIVESLAPK